jgi:dodecin
MSIAKNIEISSKSTIGFEDAIKKGIQSASRTIQNIRSAWIKEQKVDVVDGNVTEYSVTMIITFVLSERE